ncbi:MAG: glycosyltransferase [Ruminococcus sp.]|nr:glycosyltransferase [Ruminococcus sp.]MDE6848400.1 glycosyltransferase [Ruminococcus sp.]MDE7138015.1 glycosyltransferase [Ruminococcus sp.]
MRVVQLLPTVSYGDAVSNDALALDSIILKMGLETGIYAEITGKNLPKGKVRKVGQLKNLKKDDIIIYHMSTGSELNFTLDRYKCRKMMIYHNITPPEFFCPYSHEAFSLTNYGYEGLDFLRDRVEYCLADSAYNKSELLKHSYKCPIDVRPVLIPFNDYRQSPDSETIRKYKDGRTNIIFVGRIAPNKKQENIIKSFYFYKKINPESRLILVGSYTGMENYHERLENYVKALGLSDVIFTGHVRFSEILAYYRIADIFLCMSEHEGFCVPLTEAMFFNIPIIALDKGAVADTLGGSGILLPDNDSVFASEMIEYTVKNNDFRRHIISGQKKRLADFSYEKTGRLFRSQLKKFIDGR